MKRTSIAVVALAVLALTACGQEEAPTAVQPGTDMGAAEGTAQTAPGAAADTSGNKAPENVTDQVPTQGQLDPIPSENKPASPAQ